MTQIKQVWARLTQVQKGLVIGAGVLAVISCLVAFVAGGSTEWRILATDLSRAEVQKVLAKLDDADVPHQLKNGGRTVEVPADRWQEIQTIVVTNDLLQQDSGKGFASALGLDITSTKAQQEFKRLVALQEELEMDIVRQEGIDAATIYVTSAKNHWTKEGSEPAKASVMIRPAPGHLVPPTQVEAIARFVAGAVKQLSAKDVVVTDTSGLVLARPDGADRPLVMTAGLAHARGARLQGAAEEALSRVFGKDRVVVRCHVDLDMEQVRTETQGFIPDSKVVLNEKIRATENTKPSAGGPVSTSSVQAGTSRGVELGSKTEDLETEYGHSRKKEIRIKDVGGVQHLALSVLADESLSSHAQAIESVAKSAVGYREDRGDSFGGVMFAPFVEPKATPIPAEPTIWETGFGWEIVKWSVTALVGLTMVAYFAVAIRRARRNVSAALVGIAEDEKEDAEPLLEVRSDPKDELRKLVDSDAGTVSKLLRNWLYEPVGSR